MPDEVFEMWLEPIAEHYGWPFKNGNDRIEETKWFNVFGGFSLNTWVTAIWKREEINLTTTPLNYVTRIRISSIINRCVEGLPTLTAGVADSEERFRACAEFIMVNGNIPKPIIVLFRNGEAEIIDGNHRIAALFHVGPPNGYVVPAWIIENRGEV